MIEEIILGNVKKDGSLRSITCKSKICLVIFDFYNRKSDKIFYFF